MSDKYNTETASLRATIAKFRKLDTDSLTIKGQDISELIGSGNGGGSGSVTIKHAQDTRTTVTQNDLWGQWVETLNNGTVVIHDDEVVNPNGGNAWNTSITKVENNKAYVGNGLFANIQTEKIKDGRSFFYMNTALTSFSGNLKNLEKGGKADVREGMFGGCSNLTTFTSDLSSLTNGMRMFCECSNLTTFECNNLSNLTNGSNMFFYCNNLTTFSFDLSNLTNGQFMFRNCSNLATFNCDNLSSLTNGYCMFYKCHRLESFNSDLSSLTNGNCMFYDCSALTSFSSDLCSLARGYRMFYNSKFTTFDADLSSLTNGYDMFYSCTNLTTFSSDLSSLVVGYSMFRGCTSLTTFDKDMSNLENGNTMFSASSKLSSFTSDLSNLRTCDNMFWGAKLKTFSIDLKSLVNGNSMFARNSTLTTFVSDLRSLVCGNSMFYATKLSPKSVMYIINTIKNLAAEKKLYEDGVIPYVTYENYKYSAPSGFTEDGKYVYSYKTNNGGGIPYVTTTSLSTSSVGKLTIGIGVANNNATTPAELQEFAEEVGFNSWADLKQAFIDKGWDVTWQYSGSETSIPYDLRGDRAIPCSVYTKLIEILPEGNEVGEKFYTDEQKMFAQYCNEDGTKFYNITWGHDVTHPEEFQQFDSLETACVSYGVMPKEYLETNGQPTLF